MSEKFDAARYPAKANPNRETVGITITVREPTPEENAAGQKFVERILKTMTPR